MKKNTRFLCLILSLSILFGIFTVACAPVDKPIDPKKDPVTVNNPVTDPTPSNKKDGNFGTFSGDEELLRFVKENCEMIFTITTDDLWIEEEAVVESAPMDGANGADFEEEAFEEPDVIVNVPASNPTGESDDFSLDEDMFVTPETEKGKEVEVSDTNLVEENVDEGDILKTDGDYIYILRNNELIIVSAKEKNSEVLSYYKIFAEGEGDANEMYIKGDRAIIVGNTWHYEEEFNENTNFGKPLGKEASDFSLPHRTGYSQYSAVYVIDISDRKAPKELSTVLIEGELITSREIGGEIYLVTNKFFDIYEGVDFTVSDIMPYVYDGAHGLTTVSSTNVYRPVFENVTSSVMTIASVDYVNGDKTELYSVLGSGADIYMTAESLYIFGHNYYNNTAVAKYSVGEKIEYVASVVVPGYTATDFSYNEYNGKFRIATTVNESGGTQNNVYVYDGALEKIGELIGLAPGEKIYSVRFSGNTAYIVTFRQVDPLFVIDMTENDPKVLGELKIPGFSTYLHPVGDGLLLGIGRETRDNVYKDYYGKEYISSYTVGIKISLFDVSDPTKPKEIDVENMVGGEHANADALGNHKAFTYSSVKNTGYFAIDTYDGNGFVCVSVKDGELDCEIVYGQGSKYYGYDSYNSRVCFVGDALYFYQYNRITVYNRNTLEEIHTVTIK